jgi:hypothetical protein
MKVVNFRQLTDTGTGLMLGDQRLRLGWGEPPLSLPQHPHVRSPRILKHRRRRLSAGIAGLGDPTK